MKRLIYRARFLSSTPPIKELSKWLETNFMGDLYEEMGKSRIPYYVGEGRITWIKQRISFPSRLQQLSIHYQDCSEPTGQVECV
jgi:hypothetical protein